jgi:hypothetical protein
MNYRQIAAEFFYGLFRAGLCVELLICKLFHDLFGWIAERFANLCIEGMQQMARLRGEPSLTSPPEHTQVWMGDIRSRVGRFRVVQAQDTRGV